MAQTPLPFQYQAEKSGQTTAFGGLPLYFELAVLSGVIASITKHLRVREAGWDDIAVVVTLLLLNLAGGTHVEDINRLEQDAGLRRIMFLAMIAHLPRRQRRQRERDWFKAEKRGEPNRAFPSTSSVFRYLERFHDPEMERLRKEALAEGRKAFIPVETEAQKALWLVVRDQVGFLHTHRPVTTATVDMDATCVETHKSTALHCYKGFAAYQPLNFYWHELDTVFYSEFRDGNVPAGFGLRDALVRALDQLPEGVEKVLLRSDSAGYCWELLRYCAEGRNKRFGKIDFAVSADVSDSLKQEVAKLSEEDWRPLMEESDGQKIQTGQEYAEVVYVPKGIGHSKRGPDYRFIVIREKLAQLELPGLEDERQQQLPFPTIRLIDEQGVPLRYKLHALVTTLDWPAEQVIWWLRGRCGKSEQVHAVMKDDLAGGTFPSRLFGANAAWWAMMIIALNLNTTMKQLVLGDSWVRRRMKAVRYHFIHIAARLVVHARQLVVKVAAEALAALQEARRRIHALANAPPG